MWMVSSLLCVAAWVACVARTEASPTTVNRVRGHSVSLHAEIPAGPDVAEVTWRLLSPRKKIVTYSNKDIDYYGSEEYKRRITFHPGNFSLEIRNLQREDAGDYELTVTTSSGAQTQSKIRLQVYDWAGTVRGTQGETVFLPAGITPLQNVSHVVWRSNGTKIAESANGFFSYFGTEEYKRRLTLHPGNFSLEIRDLRREDADEYEVEIAVGSGAEFKTRVRMEVDDWAGTVRGTQGETVFLPAGITTFLGVSEVVWRSNGTKLAEYASGTVSYFGTEEYKRRLTLHPGNFSLEIRDLRREDAGEYEVEITVGSGAEFKARVQLEVDDSGDRSSHTAWIIHVVVVVIIVILLCCGIGYIKRHDLRSLWDKHMGKKSGTSDEPAVTQSLKSRPDGEQSS